MSETPEPQAEKSAENLASEFHNLGDNLKKFFVNAWESEQRKTIQTEIEAGLNDLGDTLKQTAEEIQDSETGQRIKTEATDFRDRVRDGEVEQKVRADLTNFLKKLNTELEKAIPPEESSIAEEEEIADQE
jgi:DNA-binding transcriptional regulator GbsR (MarR family)